MFKFIAFFVFFFGGGETRYLYVSLLPLFDQSTAPIRSQETSRNEIYFSIEGISWPTSYEDKEKSPHWHFLLLRYVKIDIYKAVVNMAQGHDFRATNEDQTHFTSE